MPSVQKIIAAEAPSTATPWRTEIALLSNLPAGAASLSPGRVRARLPYRGHTLEGSFSTVSKPNFATKYVCVGKLSPRSTQCTPLHCSKITFFSPNICRSGGQARPAAPAKAELEAEASCQPRQRARLPSRRRGWRPGCRSLKIQNEG